MPAKPTLDSLFDKSGDGDDPCCAKCGGKTFERKRVRIGYDVVIIYCAGCKTALGVVPAQWRGAPRGKRWRPASPRSTASLRAARAMAPEEMIESLRREIKKA